MINFESNAPVKLKGVGDGFWVTIDPSCPEDLIKSKIDEKFKNLNQLALNSRVVIDTGGAKGYEKLFENIKNFLVQSYKVGTVSLPPEDRKVPTERIRHRDLKKSWNQRRSNVLMMRGRVRSGQKIEAKMHVVITGDVNPGSEIKAGGDIIILGKLAGIVHAGLPANNDAIVFALDFRPTQISIGEITAAGVDEQISVKPEYACVENRRIMVKDYLKDNPFRRMPWPETI